LPYLLINETTFEHIVTIPKKSDDDDEPTQTVPIVTDPKETEPVTCLALECEPEETEPEETEETELVMKISVETVPFQDGKMFTISGEDVLKSHRIDLTILLENEVVDNLNFFSTGKGEFSTMWKRICQFFT